MNAGDAPWMRSLTTSSTPQILVAEIAQLAHELGRDPVDPHLDEIVDRHLAEASGADLLRERRRGAVDPRLDELADRQVGVACLLQPLHVDGVDAVNAHLRQLVERRADVAFLAHRGDEAAADVVNRELEDLFGGQIPIRLAHRRDEVRVGHETPGAGAATIGEAAVEVDRARITTDGEADVAGRPPVAARAQPFELAHRNREAEAPVVVALELQGDPWLAVLAGPVVLQPGAPGAVEG